ncbi:ankyrin repeat-containing domain protein [Morchella snyderi]|nr:ankyrin repeat-containing domain protein [Morchella snyderi]
MWLKELLPKDLPNTRIMAFNHNSKWKIDAPVKSIEECGHELLNHLREYRTSPQEAERKIIFIGHSFGGIIIKQALVIASRSTPEACDRYQPLKDFTTSIIFLGVPHDGSKLTSAGKLLSYATYWLGSSTELLESLEPGSDLLCELNHSFLSIFEVKKLVNFYESYKTKKWLIPLSLAVDAKSGSLPGAMKCALEADHVGMNKFRSSEDSNYKLVLWEIRNAAKMREYFFDTDTQALLKSLTFRGMDDRTHLITTNHAKTLLWIWTYPEFCSWNQNISGVFWVVGKPGSGKSTLSKYVLNKLKKDSQSKDPPSALFTGFFFDDRGGKLSKSFKGFLQTILYQLLSQIPYIYCDLITAHKEQLAKSKEGFDWPLPTLRESLLNILKDDTTPPVYIFIDALDECEVNPTETLSDEYSMLRFLEDICNIPVNTPRVFATSRYNERINATMGRINKTGTRKLQSIRLEELSSDDMKKYVASEVLRLPDFCRNMVEAELLSRAQGVFLWVRLVIYDLLGCAELSSLAEIKEILCAMPSALDELYTRMLGKIASKHQYKAEVMLRWVLFAGRPLSLEEFRYATAIRSYEQFSSIQDVEASMPRPQTTLESNTVQIFSGGLLETSRTTDHRGSFLVQIIHQSAKEFLISRPRIIGGIEMRLTQSISNAYITDVCISYLKLFSGTEGVFYPYVAQYWPTHLRNASSSGYLSTYNDTDLKEVDTETQRAIVNAQKFIFSKSARLWISNSRHGSHPIRIAYEENLRRIIKNAIERKFEFNIPDFYVAVIEQAAHFGHEEVVRDLLKDEKCFHALKLQSDRYWAALYTASSKGYEGIVFLLLNHKANVNAHHGEWGNALLVAKIRGFKGITQLLIENGANFHPKPNGAEYREALYSTEFLCNPSMIRFLVENGADVNPQYRIYCNRTAISESRNFSPQKYLSPPQRDLSVLQSAIFNKSGKDVVRILIDGGADTNAPDGIYGSAFAIALTILNPEVMQLLAENGADTSVYNYEKAMDTAFYYRNWKLVEVLVQCGGDVDTQHQLYGSILQLAIDWGQEDIARLLVGKGAKINVQSGCHGSALHAAVYRGSGKIVQLLLNNGANLEPQNDHGNALQMAIQLAQYDIARALADNAGPAEINAQGGRYGNCLSTAINRGNQELVELLVKNGADIYAHGSRDGNTLQQKIFLGHDDTMRFLVGIGADVNAKGGHYGSPLHAAAQRGEENIVQFLVENGANINIQNNSQESALQFAVRKGLKEMVKFLLENGADINAPGGIYGQALQAGVCCHDELVDFLVKNGADVNGRGGYYGNALQAAAATGKLVMVQFLVEQGADINAQGGHYENAFLAAVYNGHEAIVDVFIKYNTNIDMHRKHSSYGSPLHIASFRGHVEIMKLLAQNGAGFNDGGHYGNALQAAAIKSLEIVEYLISRAADVNFQGGFYGSALQAAAYYSHAEIVQLLVKNRANINAQGGVYGNALQAASINGIEIVQYLVENGANVNVKGGKYGGALQAAAYHQNWNVVRYLVKKGADVNACGPYGSILQITASRNHEETFNFLMVNGADINAQSGSYGNVLQAAAIGSLNIVKILYEAGVDVNTQGGYYGNALQAAAHRGDELITPFLIGRKANANAQGGRYGTALQAAAQRGRKRIVDFLIYKEKVDVNVQGGIYHTALQAACTAVRDRGVVELLVREGAEVNARGGKYNTALQAAATRNLENVQFLIKNGADVNAQGGYFGNALQAAATRNLEIVRFLILNGADVNAHGGHHGNALQAAKAHGKGSIVELLLQNGAKWKTGNSDASIPTHIPAILIQAEDRVRSCSSEPLCHVSLVNS